MLLYHNRKVVGVIPDLVTGGFPNYNGHCWTVYTYKAIPGVTERLQVLWCWCRSKQVAQTWSQWCDHGTEQRARQFNFYFWLKNIDLKQCSGRVTPPWLMLAVKMKWYQTCSCSPFFHPLSLHQSTSAVLKHVSPLSSTMTVLSMNYVVMAGTVGLITERLLCVSCRWVACRSVWERCLLNLPEQASRKAEEAIFEWLLWQHHLHTVINCPS